MNQKGFSLLALLTAVVVVLIIGGGAYYVTQQNQVTEAPAYQEQTYTPPVTNKATTNASAVKWDIGPRVDDNFNKAVVTLSLPNGIVRTAEVNVRNDCKELNQQNIADDYMKQMNAGAVFEKEPDVIKPGLACVSWDTFIWYGVFVENEKYYVKQLADDTSGLGRTAWKIVKEI